MKQSNRVSVFEIDFQGRAMFAVYDALRQTIVTFLTDEMMEEQR